MPSFYIEVQIRRSHASLVLKAKHTYEIRIETDKIIRLLDEREVNRFPNVVPAIQIEKKFRSIAPQIHDTI